MESQCGKVGDEKQEKSVWPAQALENAEAGPAPAAIDWDTIRKQKDEFVERKWRGESQERITWREQRFGEC